MGSGPDGLGADEVARRQAEFCPNRIAAADKAPLWLALGRDVRQPVWLYILPFAFAMFALEEGRRLLAARMGRKA